MEGQPALHGQDQQERIDCPGQCEDGCKLQEAAGEIAHEPHPADAENAVAEGVAGELAAGRSEGVLGTIDSLGIGDEGGRSKAPGMEVEERVVAEKHRLREATDALPKVPGKGHGASGAGLAGLGRGEIDSEEGRGGDVPNGGVCQIDAGTAERVFGFAAGDGLGEAGEPVGGVGAAGIGAGDDLRVRRGDGDIAATGYGTWTAPEATGFVADGQERGILTGRFKQPFPGAVGRATVYDDDFSSGLVLLEQTWHKQSNVHNFVENGSDNTDGGHGESISTTCGGAAGLR